MTTTQSSDIPILENKNAQDDYLDTLNPKKVKGPNALNFLFLLDQKLKGMDCNKKADEQLVYFAENNMSTVNQFAPLQAHSKPKNSADWTTNKLKNSTPKRYEIFQKWVKNPSDKTREKYTKLRKKCVNDD